MNSRDLAARALDRIDSSMVAWDENVGIIADAIESAVAEEREAILRAVQFEAENQSLPYPTRSTMEMLGKKIRARGTP